MALETPLHMQAGSYSGLADRTLEDTIFASAGVIASGDLKITQRAAGANMSVDAAIGVAVITGTDVSEQGKYLCRSTAVTNVPLATAPGAGNSRIDAIYARVRDSAAIGGSFDDWIIAAVTGAAASSPTPPAIPASSFLLGDVLVGSSVSSIVNANITDKRVEAIYANADPKTELLSVQVGSLPAAGVPLRRIIGSAHGACVNGFGVASFLPDIDLTSLGLAHGYTAIVCNADPQTNVVGVCAVSSTSTLTALSIQTFDPSGAPLAAGTNARANYIIICA